MRKIAGAAFLSLDGVMQAPGGPTEDPTGGFKLGGWLPQFGDEAVFQRVDALFGRDWRREDPWVQLSSLPEEIALEAD